MARQAALLVADEIYYNLQGKALLHGIYHSDLAINSNPQITPQLLFFFIAETDISEPFQSLAVEVTLPDSPPVRQQVLINWPVPVMEGRSRLFYRHPLLIQAPSLRPGPIIAKIIHETGEIIVGAPWVILNPTLQPQKAN